MSLAKLKSAAKAVRYVKAEEKRLDEKKRRQAQLERERRILEELNAENSQENTGKLARASEKTKRLISQRGREVQLRRTRKVKLAPAFEDSLSRVAQQRAADKFEELKSKHNIAEEEEDAGAEFGERMSKIFGKLLQQYCEQKNFTDSEFAQRLTGAVEKKGPNVLDRYDLVSALASLLFDGPVELEIEDEEVEPNHKFIMQFIKTVESKNRQLAVQVFDALLEFFLPDSLHRKEYLHMLVYSDCWSAFNAIKMAQKCLSLTIDLGTKLLHKAKTYGVEFFKLYGCLTEEDPLDALTKVIKGDGDKSLDAVLTEMRKAAVPEELLNKVEQIVSKVLSRLPDVFLLDLSEEDILACIEKVKALDFIDPDIDKFVDALVDLCIGVQDYTTIYVGSEKIEGFFPRVTQLVSVVMLLVSKTPHLTGCVLEINTGEGKSCIVAMLSAVLAIRGAHVDVISSSPMLARRDAEEWQPFFKMFHLSVGVAPAPGLSELGPQQQIAKQREGYQCDIVYGTVGAFAADILRHEFEKVDIRGSRRCDAIVVDEIDYMTLDQGTQLTYLSHFATGMRHLEQLLAAVWTQVCAHRPYRLPDTEQELWAVDKQFFHKTVHEILASNMKEAFHPFDILKIASKLDIINQEDLAKLGDLDDDSDVIRDIAEKLGIDQQANILNHIENVVAGEVSFRKYRKIGNKRLELYGKDEDPPEGNVQEIEILLQSNGTASLLLPKEDLVELTVRQLHSQFAYSKENDPPTLDRNPERDAKLFMPGFMKPFILHRLATFVENALQAISMKQDREYMIYEDRDRLREGSSPNAEDHHFHRIIPVDYKASGILETNKQWGDGLQQFLEMKHQLSLSDMTTVTNFMSNFHFFKRYAQALGVFGVTGTIGDEAGSTFMQKHFKVSCYPIPTHKRSKMIELPTIYVRDNADEWLRAICRRISEVTQQTDHHTGQTVVVICEDIMTVEQIEDALISSGTVPRRHVHLYSRSDRHEVEGKEFLSNDVILTTALGGRGTDFAVNDDVHASGGLFVLLTHLAPNRRVERQMFGRTARKGKPGMVQMILHKEHLDEPYRDQPVNIMRYRREEMEKERILEMEKNELGPTDLREDLFDHFCEKLDIFCRQYSEEEKHLLSTTHKSTEDVPDFIKKMSEKMDYEPAMNDLKETWADWLMQNEQRIQSSPEQVDAMRQELDEVIEKRTAELLSNKSDDFYDYMRQALARMHLYETMNRITDCGTYDIWEASIRTDPAYRAACLYNQAYIRLNQREGARYVEDTAQLLEAASDAIQVFLAEASNTVVCCFMAAEAAGFKPHYKGDTNLTRQLETRMNLYNVWRESIGDTIEKLKKLQQQEQKRFNLKGTYIFGLVDNPDPWTEVELSKLFEIGLYKMFEVDSKPRYKASPIVTAVLAQLRKLCGLIVQAQRRGLAEGFSKAQLTDVVSALASAVTSELTRSERQEWASVPGALQMAQILRKANIDIRAEIFSAKRDALLADVGEESFRVQESNIADKEWSRLTQAVHSDILTDDVRVLVDNLSNDEVTLGVKLIFQRMAAEKVVKNLQAKKKLPKRITRYIVHKCVPAAVLELDEPGEFEIPAALRRKASETVLEACRDAIGDSLTGACKANFKILLGLRQALELAASTKSLVDKISLGVEVGLITNQLGENLAASALVQDTMDGLELLLKGVPHYRDDKRRELQVVTQLRDRVLQELEVEIRGQVVEACMACITAIMDHYGGKVLFKLAN